MDNRLEPVASTALLHGISVVELSHRVAGAYCGKVLAQLGASVMRAGPPTDGAAEGLALDMLRLALHGAKQVVALDDPALDAALDAADIVVIETGSPDAAFAARLAAVAAAPRPRGRLVTIAAGVQAGVDVPGCGLTSAAWAGMSWAVGAQGRPPLTLPADVPDYVTGINGAAAALASLLADGEEGAAPVEVSARAVLAFYVGMLAPNHIAYGRPWQRAGRRTSMSGGMYPCGLFPCADGFVVMYCRRDSEWKGLIAAMGTPDWSHDERFQDPRLIATRFADEADAVLMPWLRRRTRSELTALGLQHGFAVGPVRMVSELLDDVQFNFRGSLAPLAGGARTVMVPSAPWRIYQPSEPPPATRPWPATSRAAPLQPRRPPSEWLSGLRVLDLSWVWSGPMVTAILSDLGAEVLKIEHPSHLDSVRTRGRPPAGMKAAEGPATEVNPWFNQLNHGKLSLIADLRSPEGRADVLRLARSCDIVVENMRPGVLDRLGLGYADLVRESPAITMLSMSMAGASGPLSQMKGYAGIMSALAGLESLVGYRDGGVDEITGMMMTAFGDPNAAIHAISVLLAALHRRRRTGRGVWIDLAQTDAILAIMSTALVRQQVEGQTPIQGNAHPRHVPHGHYACRGSDRWVALSVQSDGQWEALQGLTGGALAAWAECDAAARAARRAEIDAAVAAWCAQRTQAEATETLLAAGIAAAPVATFEEMSRSAWMRDRSFARSVRHPYIGDVEVYMPPWYFGGVTPGKALPAPLLGADTERLHLHSEPAAT